MTELNSLQPATEPNVEAFAGQVLNDLGAAFSGVLVNIGRKLGLYAVMAELGTFTAEELASRAQVHPRYVREWLNNQAAGGYVGYCAQTDRYHFGPARAAVLADADSPAYMAPAFEVAASFWLDEEKILEAFRAWRGFGWHEHHPRLFCGTEMFFRAGYLANLVPNWLPTLDGVVERLQAGARVADIGCGHGASTILMAQAFPASSFLGVDYHDASIATARERAAASGVAGNTRFEVAGARDFQAEDLDLICFMDCLHDLGDPVGALSHCAAALNPGGKVMLVEPRAGDRTEENFNPVGRMFYAASTLACTPNALFQAGGLALGAQAGEARLAQVARDAGFRSLRRAAETPVNLVLELSL